MKTIPDIEKTLARERSYFDESIPGRRIWQRFCPQPIGDHPLLQRLERYLQEPETRRELEAYDETERYPRKIVEHMQRLGLNELFCDIGPVDPKATAYHLSELNVLTGRLTASLAITVGVNSLALLCAYRGASSNQLADILGLVQKGAFSALALTELEHGSNLKQIQSYARAGTLSDTGTFAAVSNSEQATHYLIQAHKHLINGGKRHQVIFVLLREISDDGVNDYCSRNLNKLSLFWMERDLSYTDRTARWFTAPAPAADISNVLLDGVLIDVSHRIGKEGDGHRLIQETLAMSRGGVAALAVGTLSRAQDLVLTYVRRRKMYGRRIGELGGIAGHLVRIDALERAAVSASLRAVAWVNACGSRAAPYTAVAKLMSCRLAEEAVTEGRHVLGARALLRNLPYARLINDVSLFGVFDGTSHLMLDEIQMYLSIETRRWSSNKVVQLDTVAMMEKVYTLPPRSLVEAACGSSDTRPFSMLAHARNIAQLSGEISVLPVAELAEALVAVTEEAKRREKWGNDQELRFALAEVYSLIEVILSLIELFDPIRRATFTVSQLTKHPADELGYQHAFAFLGSRACAKLSQCAAEAALFTQSEAKSRFLDSGYIAGIQSRFLDRQDEVRRTLAEILLEESA